MSERADNGTVKICVRCHVAGRVQGVFYRATTRHEARQLGIKGYAKNLHDGRVEVVACGSVEAIEALQSWLSKGPADARVTGVSCEAIDYRDYQSFTIA
ncbi:MAG: acylphosphatase [Candidatus Thiodiazotropha sp. (ex Lucina aurantia)]|uniref:acylphosphatase n=2 Tax=Candidatus Thiodiazotropha TaxID=1913444 RepID=A0A7Z0VNL2_9GAMM|nr:acylphosphatase [Candidatus Thiodiazotropha endolucinida]MBT3011977.1 acylphosphatase [Candidatus Thiodiazotropha sp. (ex Lucina pensylvanica)]MBT3016932.1 acylphosphatase [Candidatus Thiodiazotropha taylori]MBT3040543.1 acylphosphatase [Candidatus Thiodiazotropha sp. (ex Codakia orbicularis)]MBV2104852.1 acylphosphatase [Candidatus Thiodiazotropha sp. (ex Lucina aurantia)]MCU7943456.1 acylphosphatase [Candidatus Thiodiazotropha sp. (ex Cardiolucina cf. quadrata)]